MLATVVSLTSRLLSKYHLLRPSGTIKAKMDEDSVKRFSSLIKSAIIIQKAKDNGNKNKEDEEYERLMNILLYIACAKGSQVEVRRLLKRENVNFVYDDKYSRTPLHAASMEGRLDIVKLLHNRNADLNAIDDEDDTALNAAIDHNHWELVEWFFTTGVDFEAEGEDGRRALFRAVYDCSEVMVKLLLAKGANINSRDDAGFTILSAAIRTRDIHMVDILLNESADPNAKDKDGSTALHVAFTECYPCPEITALLLKHDANINARNKDGCTLLHVAVIKGSPLMLEELLKNRANVCATDNNDQTPKQVASDRGYSSFVEKLSDAEDAEAKANIRNKRRRARVS